jgi:hypothetical protein
MQITWLKVIAIVSLMETVTAGAIPHKKRDLHDGVRRLLQALVLTCQTSKGGLH